MKYLTQLILSFGAVLGLAQKSDLLATKISVQNPATACQKLGRELVGKDITVVTAEFLTAGSTINLTQEFDLASCGFKTQAIPTDLCRIAMNVATSYRSSITLEAWLPTNWTGRFLSTGNGGISGCLQYYDVAYATSLGFAAVGTNNGHNGTRGLAFANNSDIVHDFVDRAMHTGVVVGKKITKQYYGTAHRKSYYLGCSTGGRQGFKAIQSYPGDFDGVIAGAPALRMASLTSWSATFFTIFGKPTDPTFVPLDLWAVIHQEILNQCDGLDGVVDGIIEDPQLCYFRPQSLLCSATTNNSSSCLTSPQVSAVSAAFSDYYGLDKQLIYPRMQPGSEVVASRAYYTSGAFPYSEDWFRYVVYNDSTWDPATFTRLDAKNAIDQNPFNVQTWEGDLSAFKAKGGKVLHYHGLMDGIITSENSPRYYRHVSQTMGLKTSQLDDFYRFFRVSGLAHCSGGDGANAIGQNFLSVSSLDPQNNILLRVVDWVENGKGPETLTGTKFVNNDPRQGVDFTRRHCKYPKRNVCVDAKNHKSPDAWRCV